MMKYEMPTRPISSAERLDRCQAELITVRRRLESAETANQRLVRDHAVLDEHVSVLTRLWVAASALHEAQNETCALRAVEEVMINLAHTEAFGVYEVEGHTLIPVHAYGVEGGRAHRHMAEGVVAEVIESGDTWRARSPYDGAADEPAACIPLRLGNHVTAVLIVWSFLPQKLAFEPFDTELFALLANRVAPALRIARLLEAAA